MRIDVETTKKKSEREMMMEKHTESTGSGAEEASKRSGELSSIGLTAIGN
jgi:hypothetical protein